jgi:hypothetical protein
MATVAASLASRLLSFPKRKPFLFGVGFSAAKTSFADFLVQRFVEKREEIDLKRNLTFGIFGFAYLGARRRGRATGGGEAGWGRDAREPHAPRQAPAPAAKQLRGPAAGACSAAVRHTRWH